MLTSKTRTARTVSQTDAGFDALGAGAGAAGLGAAGAAAGAAAAPWAAGALETAAAGGPPLGFGGGGAAFAGRAAGAAAGAAGMAATTGADGGGGGATGAALGAGGGGTLGSLIVGAAVGFGGNAIRTVSFFGWTLAASPGLGGTAPGVGLGVFSDIKLFRAQNAEGLVVCQTFRIAMPCFGRRMPGPDSQRVILPATTGMLNWWITVPLHGAIQPTAGFATAMRISP